MIHLEFFGAHLGVRGEPSRLQHVAELWSAFARSPSSLPAHAKILDVDGADFTQTLSQLVVDVNAFALESCPDLAIHAGVVDANGAIVTLPGTSGAGKSTLTAACVRAGMDYVSDEALCIPYDEVDVRPYARPVALSPWSIQAIGLDHAGAAITSGGARQGTTEFIVAPSVLGGVCVNPGPLQHVVIPRRGAAGAADLSPLHRADAVALMLRLSFNHFRRPADAFELIMKTMRMVDVWELHYGDPTEAARLLLDRFG